jgi:hydrogenase expression/formation protein HypD
MNAPRERAIASPASAVAPALQIRDPERGRRLVAALETLTREIGRAPVSVMHVCGSHEQAIARFGLRASFPEALDVIMGPGCPVCVTDQPEVDEAVALAEDGAGVRVATYGDMLRVPGTARSLADAQAQGAHVDVVYSVAQAVELALRHPQEEVVFFASGFETTAVATAAVLLADPPANLFVLSAHKWVPAAMEVVARSPDSAIQGYLAAGHAATITGYGLFEPFVRQHRRPVVVAGFEPLDILSGLVLLVEQVLSGRAEVVNAFPRCVSKEGNRRALDALFRVFRTDDGDWRGIARIPRGDLRLLPELAAHDASVRFAAELDAVAPAAPGADAAECRCGAIMTGRMQPTDCRLFGAQCRPSTPVGACMVSTEGVCRIWHEHGTGARGSA